MTSVLDVSSKRTTVEQLQRMVNFLEGHKYLAAGKLRSKEQIALSARLWRECADILNTEEDSRCPAEWKKYFNHYKTRLAAKVRRIKDVEDGKYICVDAPLTEVEKRFAAICGFETRASSGTPTLVLEINPLKQSNDSTGSISDKCSSYDSEHDISRDSVSDEEDNPVIFQTEPNIINRSDHNTKPLATSSRLHNNKWENNPETYESEREITLQLTPQSKRRKSYEEMVVENNGEKESNLETFGQNLAMKMQTLQGNQRIIVEKIINDTLFFAEMGCLTVSHASYFANDLHCPQKLKTNCI